MLSTSKDVENWYLRPNELASLLQSSNIILMPSGRDSAGWWEERKRLTVAHSKGLVLLPGSTALPQIWPGSDPKVIPWPYPGAGHWPIAGLCNADPP